MCHVNLSQGLVRNKWQFDGYITSDCGAVEVIGRGFHNFTQTKDETVKVALQAGVDSNCGVYLQKNTANAVHSGAVNEKLVSV